MNNFEFRIAKKRPPGGDKGQYRACNVSLNKRFIGVLVLTDDEWEDISSDNCNITFKEAD